MQARGASTVGDDMPPALRALVERFASDEAALASSQLHMFDAHEPLLALRTAVLPVLRAPPLALIERRLALAALAQQAARPHVAMAELFAHRQLCVEHGVAPEVLLRGALTEASVRWQNDDRAGAIGLAQQLVRRLGASDMVRIGGGTHGGTTARGDALPRDVERLIVNLPPSVEHCVLLGDALTACGRWLGEMHMASGAAVKRHLKCAVAIYERRAPSGLAGAHLTLAEYVDRRYQALQERIESAAWLASLRLKAAKRAERAQYESANAGPHTSARLKREIQRNLDALVRQVELDNDETKRVLRERGRALVDAVREYGAALRLQADTRATQAAFRLASLWFAAQQLPGDDVPARTSAAVAEIVAHVPARTFLPLVYQLASRLSQRQADESAESDGGRFQRALQALLLATASRLPQQSLWTLIALSNGARLPADQGSKSFHVVDQDKVDAAHALLRRLRVGDDGARLGAILDEMTQLADAYIDFASSAIPKGADNKPQIDVSGLLLGVPELPRVAVPTLQLELSEEEERSGLFVHVTGFPTTFRTVGGINVPKIIDCIGADGRLYRQLVKGKDDLRQDMVMQQTFAMCNALLRGATETRRRCLRIGTYRVVPLTPGAGVLEWCNNTMPLGSWIEGDRGLIGARRRYRPNDMQRARGARRARAVRAVAAAARIRSHLRAILAGVSLLLPRELCERRRVVRRAARLHALGGGGVDCRQRGRPRRPALAEHSGERGDRRADAHRSRRRVRAGPHAARARDCAVPADARDCRRHGRDWRRGHVHALLRGDRERAQAQPDADSGGARGAAARPALSLGAVGRRRAGAAKGRSGRRRRQRARGRARVRGGRRRQRRRAEQGRGARAVALSAEAAVRGRRRGTLGRGLRQSADRRGARRGSIVADVWRMGAVQLSKRAFLRTLC
jgi:hypothetical protein